MVINDDIINIDNVTVCFKRNKQDVIGGKEEIFGIDICFTDREVRRYMYDTEEERDSVFKKLIAEFE